MISLFLPDVVFVRVLDLGALAANGLSINTAAHTGTGPTAQQQISQDVLNLYDLLTRMSHPQGQARARVPSLMQDQASLLHGHGPTHGHTIGNGGGCPQPLPFDQQYTLPYNGHQDMRGSSSDARSAVDPLMAFVTQSQAPMYLPLTAPNPPPHQYMNECGNYGRDPLGTSASLGKIDGLPPGFPHADMGDHQQFVSAGQGSQQQVVPQALHQKPAPKQPLRALSAYNFFFRDERDRIVGETEGDYDISAEKKRELLERHWYRDRTTKRRHRKTHGKIAFTELSKVISQRWKGLPEHVKAFYHDVAAEDSLRYNREVDAQKSLQF